MWIMWIILCITRFSIVYGTFHVWKTFVLIFVHCLSTSYVNLLIHILSMWIMWIILCITRFSIVYGTFHVWKTFVLIFVQSTFFYILCAICYFLFLFRHEKKSENNFTLYLSKYSLFLILRKYRFHMAADNHNRKS